MLDGGEHGAASDSYEGFGMDSGDAYGNGVFYGYLGLLTGTAGGCDVGIEAWCIGVVEPLEGHSFAVLEYGLYGIGGDDIA